MFLPIVILVFGCHASSTNKRTTRAAWTVKTDTSDRVICRACVVIMASALGLATDVAVAAVLATATRETSTETAVRAVL